MPILNLHIHVYICTPVHSGNYAPMLADAEVITVGTEILTQLPIGTFIIKLNHRALLDAIFEISGRYCIYI